MCSQCWVKVCPVFRGDKFVTLLGRKGMHLVRPAHVEVTGFHSKGEKGKRCVCVCVGEWGQCLQEGNQYVSCVS